MDEQVPTCRILPVFDFKLSTTGAHRNLEMGHFHLAHQTVQLQWSAETQSAASREDTEVDPAILFQFAKQAVFKLNVDLFYDTCRNRNERDFILYTR